MVRKGSRLSISNSPIPGSSSTQETLPTRAGVENVDQGVLPLLEKLCATMNTVVARLDRLETEYFEATRGPADPGVVGSTSVTNPSSLVQSAVDVGFSLDVARGGTVPSAHQLNVRADPSPRTVFDYVDSSLCGDAPSFQLFKLSATVDFYGAAFALEGHSDADVELDGDGAPPSLVISDDDTPALESQAFLRRLFVRFRLR